MTHAKAIIAFLTAIAVSVSTLVASDSMPGKVITVILAALGALGVYAIPNKPAGRPSL